MEATSNLSFTHESQAPSPQSSANNSFPLLAIAVLCITAAAFLLISYYIFVTKCYFRWQQIDPLSRLSFRPGRFNEDPTSFHSPSWRSQGLDESLIREIPTILYRENEPAEFGNSSSRFSKCVVCLNKFQENDLLRVLPKCAHAFHLDCIDVWLQKNCNCPLCRSAISGRNRCWMEKIVAPNSSPQHAQPVGGRNIHGGDEDFMVIELSGEDETGDCDSSHEEKRGDLNGFLVKSLSHSSRQFEQRIRRSRHRKFQKVSSVGDEGIDVRDKDDLFLVQPIRRSFSMDSAADSHVYVSVQEILMNNRNIRHDRVSEESSSRSQRSIFSFGYGSRSRKAVLPVEF